MEWRRTRLLTFSINPLDRKANIILISSELWGEYYLSKHYYALYLSSRHRIVYVNPVNIKWSFRELFRSTIRQSRVNENLNVLSYANILPRIEAFPWILRKWIFKVLAGRIRKAVGVTDLDLVWSFDFTRFNDHRVWRARKSLLHLVEIFNHPHFETSGRYKTKSVETADLVVTIADVITKQVRPFIKGNLLQINHGADIAGFENAIVDTVKLPGTGSIKASFVGNFQYSFDFELLCELATAHPGVDFIIIAPLSTSNLGASHGSVLTGIDRLKSFDNIHLVGGVPTERLMAYLRQVDVNLILYKDESAFGHANPHKLMAYFYAGKVIVSSYIDQYKERNDLISMVTRNQELPTLFSQVLSQLATHNSAEHQERRRLFAVNNDYRNHIKKIFEHLAI